MMLSLAAPAAAQDTPIALRGQAGFLFCCGGEGFLIGGGVGARPFNNRQVEIAGDLSFLRFEGVNGFYLSGNAFYHFNTSDANFRPFAGGGLGILRGGGETEARLQIGGGLELRASSPNPIRPELRFLFTEGDVTTVILVSVGFGQR